MDSNKEDYMNLSHKALEEFRVLRLNVNKDMLKNLRQTAKKANCSKDDLLRLRCMLTQKIRTIEELIASRADVTSEEYKLLSESAEVI